MPEFLGLPCVEFKNATISLLVTETVGPRILSLRLRGGENILAEVPDFTLECPGAGRYRMRGGHRLWVAPEEPRWTYLPDDAPPRIEVTPHTLEVSQPIELLTGLQKSFTIGFPTVLVNHLRSSDQPSTDATKDPFFGEISMVVVDHGLKNCGSTPVTCSPWAITQFKPGGFAILPHTNRGSEVGGSWKKRGFVLWPYTRKDDPNISWGANYTFVHARLSTGALKIGYSNYNEWLAYFRNGTVLTKVASFGRSDTYFEQGSSSQCYCNDRFLELETLGPVTTIAPGEQRWHRETWFIRDGVSLEPTETGAESAGLPEWNFV
ncbi:MAG: hypothetical protein AAB074_12135 [Planctomycetota bacterium]